MIFDLCHHFWSILSSPPQRSASGPGGDLPDFWTFGVIYLHLHHDRVSESLWKPHKSKVLNFLHRNYTSVFFSTPKKYIFFRTTKKNPKNIFYRKWKSENRKCWSICVFSWSKFSIFRKISEFFVSDIFFTYIFFWSRKKKLVGVGKKSWFIVSM